MSRLRLAILVVLLLAVSTSAFAVGGTTVYYYSDATFTTAVGARYTPASDCPSSDPWWRWGTTSAYRKTFQYSECHEDGNVTVTCEVYNNGWTVVACP